MNGKTVQHIGGDKNSSLWSSQRMNPFLGFRALCISILQPNVSQLRALLRASVHGKLRIMSQWLLCWQSSSNTRYSWRRKAKLLAEGVKADDIQVGIMIEIPAVAMPADQFAKEVDFFNRHKWLDPTMAADRMNEQVSYFTNHITQHQSFVWSTISSYWRQMGRYVNGRWPNCPISSEWLMSSLCQTSRPSYT